MAYREDAVRAKKLELEHPTRLLLRNKIGYFFARDADDIDEGTKVSREDALQQLADQEQEPTNT
jgi:hypothetical protein